MRIVLKTLGIVALLGGMVTPVFAAGWSLTADAPLSYSFDKSQVNKQSATSGGFAAYDHQTSDGDVTGSTVMVIAPFHLGVGYEDYTVRDTTTVGPASICPSACGGTFKMNVRIVDVMIDIPMHYLNLGLGYGEGDANIDIVLPAVTNTTITPIRHAAVTQTFVSVGIPLGMRWDLHAAYHWVSVQQKDVVATNSGSTPDKLQASGEMLSAGLRFNF